ncbi:MAG: hypothetical protein KBT05_06620 [Bacteroidales bacterium]|nr:hypothetical protein [Candidatus Cryptobacteroides caccocaballi]
MKKTLYYIISAIVAMGLASCRQNEASVDFRIDVDSITAEAQGGSFGVSLSSSESWMASTDNPWITISPANGPASAECVISIDSTVVSTPRTGLVRFKNRVSGESRDIQVSQDGYGYNISLAEGEVKIGNYAYVDKRVFEVKVRTNVPFKVNIPSSAKNWLSCEEPEFNIDRGARPREVTLKFKWGINSVPLSREAKVSFTPLAGWTVDSADELDVLQAAAPEITVGHEGDSIVVLSIARNLNTMHAINQAEPMRDWDNVTLWEEGDPGYTPAKAGRVRYARFELFSTTEEIPYEVQYLTEAENLVFFSNSNSFLYDINIGENICKLTNLKRLTVSAYGLSDLPESFRNLKNLEWLDLSCNNFSELPDVLTPENFPNLHALLLNTCQRGYILDLNNTVSEKLGGFKGEFPRRLLEWEQLDTLRLSVNFIEGEMPDMLDYDVKYTEADCAEMNLPTTLVGTPKVLPNVKYFAFNLNRMYGEVPDWVLYHPNLTSWDPYSLCYPQEGHASDGTAAYFTNVPANMDYYWTFYEGYKEHTDIYIGD